jgi:alkylation response protein AidB-like acyl-CoA dehydrogenase
MFTLSEEHVMLREAAGAFAAERAPVALLRRLRDSGARHDEVTWQSMVELGWTAILVPEAHGGVGLGHVAMGLVLEALGRTLAPSPLVSTAVAGASALLEAGSVAQQARWLPALAEGRLRMALAVDEHPHHAPDRVATTAERDPAGGWRLSGCKTFVPDAENADLIVVTARSADGLVLALVHAGSAGLSVSPLHAVDSRAYADLTLDAVSISESDVLATGDAAGRHLERILDHARAALAAEMLGGARAAFEMTADYLRTRTQFGQLIGSFQALQHRAAQMLVEIELTHSAVHAALAACDKGGEDVAELVSLAKARAGDTLHLVTNECVQMHGGIGMTDAHDSGLYLKRARVQEALWGSAAFHRDRYARLAGF